ncbi:MAG: 50S ribosomal protein L30 [Clostridia bacterium]|nr:50S ribosomal protein L30 [Clostridia bacterium]
MAKKSEAASLKITLKKSLIGSNSKQIANAAALGLHKTGDVAVQPDCPQTKGKIAKISHLVEVTEA